MRYISSQMSGIKDYNFPAFHAKARSLRDRGIDCWNPAETVVDDGDSWCSIIADDIIDIEASCDEWEGFGTWYKSVGSWIEFLVAVKCAKRIFLPWYQRPIYWVVKAVLNV